MDGRGKIWVFSDPHFYDYSILEYERKQFSTIEEHNNFIVDSINKCVTEKDTVICLGDLGFNWYNYIDEIHAAKKILVLGNHDRNSAPQDAMVKMIWDMNAEELIAVMHKRLCAQASPETRQVAEAMREAVLEKCPEFEEVLVPNCVYRNGLCTEFKPCGAAAALLKKYKKN